MLAGSVGVDPGPLTLRELEWMAEGHNKSEWARFSSLMSLLANVNRDASKKPTPYRPEDFIPGGFEKSKPQPAPFSSLKLLCPGAVERKRKKPK